MAQTNDFSKALKRMRSTGRISSGRLIPSLALAMVSKECVSYDQKNDRAMARQR